MQLLCVYGKLCMVIICIKSMHLLEEKVSLDATLSKCLHPLLVCYRLIGLFMTLTLDL